MNVEKEYSKVFFCSANESNPEQELAFTVLMSNIIEIATAHANALGIGNPAMAHLGAGWVLSRVAIDMKGYPKCNTEYKLTTWVENWNRHFSTRDFCVEDMEGNVYGYARSVWMVLDTVTHENYGLSHLTLPKDMISAKECPIPAQAKHRSIVRRGEEVSGNSLSATYDAAKYTFQYSDIDFYRHVNTVKYVALLLNQFSLEDFDRNYISSFELSFLREGSYGMEVEILRHDYDASSSYIQVSSAADSQPIIFANISFVLRTNVRSTK